MSTIEQNKLLELQLDHDSLSNEVRIIYINNVCYFI